MYCAQSVAKVNPPDRHLSKLANAMLPQGKKDVAGAMPAARPDVTGNNIVSAHQVFHGSVVWFKRRHMAQLKSIVTKRINQFRTTSGRPVWQRNYFERVIRNEHELIRAREYIVNTPLKWELDRENPLHPP